MQCEIWELNDYFQYILACGAVRFDILLTFREENTNCIHFHGRKLSEKIEEKTYILLHI
jgi:hypothetical protein